jgi:hypothetical protein
MTAVSESENRAAAAAAVAWIAGVGCEKEEESAIVKQQAGTSRQHQSLPSRRSRSCRRTWRSRSCSR